MQNAEDEPETNETNDQLILVSGESGTGKSAALRNLRDPQRWLFLNCEAGKRLPFKSNFFDGGTRIIDPEQVLEAFDFATDNTDIDGIIIDTLDFLMDMFESQKVITSANTQKAWGDYNQFFKTLMQKKVVLFNKPVIILAHSKEELDEAAGIMRRSVPIKGALKGAGVESFFSTVVSTKRMDLKHLKDQDPKLLNITEDEEADGFKHVFQTKPTKATIGERIRSPIGMFKRNQLYIDNDVQILLDHLKAFYKI